VQRQNTRSSTAATGDGFGRVDWSNDRRLLGPIGNIPPAEAKETFYAQRDVLDMVA